MIFGWGTARALAGSCRDKKGYLRGLFLQIAADVLTEATRGRGAPMKKIDVAAMETVCRGCSSEFDLKRTMGSCS
jgi:hypothetical protein